MSSTGLPGGGSSSVLLFQASDVNDSSVESVTPDLNNTDSTHLTEEDYVLYWIAYYLSSYLLWVLLFVGLPGNVASIYTIMSMPTVSSSKAHVAILSLTDSMAIISKFTYLQISKYQVEITGPGCAIIMFVQQFSSVYPNWIVVAMTVERFLAVWFPLRVGRMYTRRKALIVLVCLAIITAGIYLFLLWAFTEDYSESHGYSCTTKEEYLSFLYGTFYWLDSFYHAVIPCLLILTGNALIITNIKRARKAQRHLTNAFDQGGRKARDQRQITVMLVVVSVVFLLLIIPNAIFYCVKPTWQNYLTTLEGDTSVYESVKYSFTFRFVHFLADTNHAVNFYLYFLSMSTFRRRFMDAIRCRSRTGRRPAGSSVYRTSQTYMHQSSETARPDTAAGYSAYKRHSKHQGDNVHCLKSYTSNNNRSNNSPCHQDNNSGATANSEV